MRCQRCGGPIPPDAPVITANFPPDLDGVRCPPTLVCVGCSHDLIARGDRARRAATAIERDPVARANW